MPEASVADGAPKEDGRSRSLVGKQVRGTTRDAGLVGGSPSIDQVKQVGSWQAEQREDEPRVNLKIHRRVIAGLCLDPKSYEALERDGTRK